jgi:hypothetical protein
MVRSSVRPIMNLLSNILIIISSVAIVSWMFLIYGGRQDVIDMLGMCTICTRAPPVDVHMVDVEVVHIGKNTQIALLWTSQFVKVSDELFHGCYN